MTKEKQELKEEHKPWLLFNRITEVGATKRILLYGKPGTGKTSKACGCAGEKGCYNVTLTEESSIAEILGMWIPKGKEFVWSNGTAIKAWLEGKLLVINEIDKASGSVLTILNAILDDKTVANLTLPNGETVNPQKGFRVIATMNGKVQELPESLADRFDIKLEIKKPCIEAINSLPEDLRPLVDMAYSRDILSISFREIVSFSKVRKTLEDDAFVVFGDLANDVRSALKLGTRPIDKPVETIKPKEVPKSIEIGMFKKLNDYWEDTFFEEQKEETFINLAVLTGVNDSVLSRIRYAFSYQTLVPRKFEREITKVFEEIKFDCTGI